jgi:hypothetical protein
MGLFKTENFHFHKSETIRETEYVPYEKTVHEHKAPTDESIKLLNEMQEKARHNILATMELESNVLKANGIFFQNDHPAYNNIAIALRFILNGKEIIVEKQLPRGWALRNKIEEGKGTLKDDDVLKFIIDEMSKEIAAELIPIEIKLMFNH